MQYSVNVPFHSNIPFCFLSIFPEQFKCSTVRCMVRSVKWTEMGRNEICTTLAVLLSHSCLTLWYPYCAAPNSLKTQLTHMPSISGAIVQYFYCTVFFHSMVRTMETFVINGVLSFTVHVNNSLLNHTYVSCDSILFPFCHQQYASALKPV